ncbi:RtcB family protein [Kordiimonas aestuarii]|uniref:RtcB family protein n=1 Tax=Kordiimonas aestuarii TaxID=1005925 RepID=UPI0021D0DAE4|nr:RtcB family protein [Kordiimonas aestuarii]
MEHRTAEGFDVIAQQGFAPVKMWTQGVPVDDRAKEQLAKTARMPFIHKHVAAMPDVHVGIGATVGSVIPTRKAIIPAAVGVDIGCGMMAARTSLTAADLPDNLFALRTAIEKAVPHGMSPSRSRKKGSNRDKGSWGDIPERTVAAWQDLSAGFDRLTDKYPRFRNTNNINQLGTLGTGNHFVEVCLDEEGHVWFMLHSGSRGVGNAIGRTFIEMAKEDMRTWMVNLPDQDLAYFPEGTDHFDDYVFAVEWAQQFAFRNRQVMMANTVEAARSVIAKPFTADVEAVNCHHNYVAREHHFGENVLVTRKGAVRARRGDMGIIPGSMGARSFIVRGLGNEESFCSCSHGAGRVMSRTEAKKRVSLEEHIEATSGVECRKDAGVIDETPAAYKPIDAVMAAQKDLVEVVHTLKQVVCVKG